MPALGYGRIIGRISSERVALLMPSATFALRVLRAADEWVTQLLRQGDAKVFKKYSQMKLQMKREGLEKMNRQANEMPLDSGTGMIQ
jgi:hypothetical protein